MLRALGAEVRTGCSLTTLSLAAGIVGQLAANNADLALFPLPLQLGMDQAIDITSSFLDGGTAIMVQKGTSRPSIFGFFGPFSWQASSRDTICNQFYSSALSLACMGLHGAVQARPGV